MKSLFGVPVLFAMLLLISPIYTDCAFAVPISLGVTGKVANLGNTLGIDINDNDDFSGKFIFDYNDDLTIIQSIAMQLYVNDYSIKKSIGILSDGCQSLNLSGTNTTSTVAD